MKVTRLAAVVIALLLPLAAVPAAPAAVTSPPGEHEYYAPAIERRCIAARGDRMTGVWRTTFNLRQVDLWCGDRLLVGEDGRCWFEYAGIRSPAPCLGR